MNIRGTYGLKSPPIPLVWFSGALPAKGVLEVALLVVLAVCPSSSVLLAPCANLAWFASLASSIISGRRPKSGAILLMPVSGASALGALAAGLFAVAVRIPLAIVDVVVGGKVVGVLVVAFGLAALRAEGAPNTGA